MTIRTFRPLFALALALVMLLASAVTAFGAEVSLSGSSVKEDPVYWQNPADPEDDPEYWAYINTHESAFTVPDEPDKFQTGPTVKYLDGRWTYINKKGNKNENYSGLAENAAGWWYVKNGYVDFDVTGVVYHPGTKSWWYVKNNKVTKGPDVQHNDAGWWYIDKKGKVDFKHNQIAHNAAGWWYIKDGKVDFSFNGIGQNAAGEWYCRNGKVDFSFTGLTYENGAWYYIRNGKVASDYTGPVKTASGTWQVRNGQVVNRR